MTVKSCWDQIKRVSALSITSAHPGFPKIYTNGRHQAIVDVHLAAFGGNGNRRIIDVSVADLIKHVELIDYETDERLGGNSSEHWSFSTENHNYPVLNRHGSIGVEIKEASSDSGQISLRLYITCTPFPQITSIDVGVAITLENGERITTARGGVPGDHSHVQITAVPEIDYSKPPLWSIIEGDFIPVARDVNCPYLKLRPRNSKKWFNDFVGLSRWKKISIKCVTLPSDHKIKTRPNVGRRYAGIYSQGSMNSYKLKFVNKVDAFSGWNASDGFHLMIWSIDPLANIGIRHGGSVALTHSDLIPRDRLISIGDQDTRHFMSPDDSRNNEVNIYLWEIFVPRSGLNESGWANETGVRNIQITDNFGNESILKIRFDYDSLLPKIID